MKISTAIMTALALVLATPVAFAQGLAAAGADAVRTQPLGENLYVLYFPTGGNVIVSIGEQGTLLVDDQYQNMVSAYLERIRELGGSDEGACALSLWLRC